MHYAENEARMWHGEGPGACLSIDSKGLRKQQITHCLKLASDQLEGARNKWLEEEEKQSMAAEAVRVMQQKKDGTLRTSKVIWRS